MRQIGAADTTNGRVLQAPEGLYRGGLRAECGPIATGCRRRQGGPKPIPAERVLLLFVSAIKLVVEIALMALAGQFVLGLLAGAKRESNFFYRLLQVLTGPVIKSVRWMAPRVVLDRTAFYPTSGGQPFDTGLRKFGALVGDRAEVGCNAVLNPGSIIGRDAIVYPNTNWRGILPANMIVKNKGDYEVVFRHLPANWDGSASIL
jgi:hypothetical protein